MEIRIMSKLTEWADAHEADLNEIRSSLDGIANGVKALDKKIDDLQNSPDAITPADQARLDSIQAAAKNLVSLAQDIRVDAETNPPAT